MAQDVNVKLNLPGIREVLKSSGVQSVLGPIKSITAHIRRGRTPHRVEAVARIGTTYKGGKRIEAKHGTLARSIGAAS